MTPATAAPPAPEAANLHLVPARRTYWPPFVTERVFRAPVDTVWRMWTTREGLAKWYWPEPFVAQVRHLDLRPGGRFEIGSVGLDHTSRGTYFEVVPNKRLGYVAPVDFLPGVEPYDRVDVIEFHPTPEGHTRMVFTSSRMHDEEWQRLANGGWGSSMDKLDRALEIGAPTYGGFTVVRDYRASPEKVWQMWTTREGLEKWFVPDGFTSTVEALDVRVGGRYAIRMRSAEHDLVNHGTYTLVMPHWELGWIWRFDVFLGPGQQPYDVPVFLNLARLPNGGTRMRFTQGPLATPEFTEGSRQGVASNFEKMAKALGE